MALTLDDVRRIAHLARVEISEDDAAAVLRDLSSIFDLIERMQAVTRLRLSAQPNAGKPRDVEGRNIYLCSPEYMASYARRFIRKRSDGSCSRTPVNPRKSGFDPATFVTVPNGAYSYLA